MRFGGREFGIDATNKRISFTQMGKDPAGWFYVDSGKEMPEFIDVDAERNCLMINCESGLEFHLHGTDSYAMCLGKVDQDKDSRRHGLCAWCNGRPK